MAEHILQELYTNGIDISRLKTIWLAVEKVIEKSAELN